MATTVTWKTKVINVLRADLLLIQSVPTEIRQLDINSFRLDLKDLEDDEVGMSFVRTHNHNPTVSVGGVSLARVVELINDYTVTFEDGQYAVNLVGANSNIADKTNVNQVSVRTSNSAGLTFSDAINEQSFLGAAVYIDTDIGSTGTHYPRGTPSNPVNNFADAKLIADSRKFHTYFLTGNLVLNSGEDLDNTEWKGRSPLQSSLSVTGVSTNNTAFRDIDLSGDMDGEVSILNCHVHDVTGFQGKLSGCGITGSVTVDNSATGHILLTSCKAQVEASGIPVLDMNGATATLEAPGWIGALLLKNINQTNIVDIDMLSGDLILDSTCSDALVTIRGAGLLEDSSQAGCIVDVRGFFNYAVDGDLSADDALRLVASGIAGKAVISPDGLTVDLYAEDQVTIIRSLNVSADQKQRTH